MMRIAVILGLFVRLLPAALTEQQLFTGVVGSELVQVRIVSHSGELMGAVYRPGNGTAAWDEPAAPIRLLKGSRTGTDVLLEEWSNSRDMSGTIRAKLDPDSLSGSWRSNNVEIPFRLAAAPLGFTSPLRGTTMTSWPLTDRLHDAVRAAKWEDAFFAARLLCVLPSNEGCSWLDALPSLRNGKEPDAIARPPWRGVVLDLLGRREDAIRADRAACDEWGMRSSCTFLLDRLVDDRSSRDTWKRTCERFRLACAAYWGADAVALSDAARHSDVRRMKELLAIPGIAVNAGGGYQFTPLQAAVVARSVPAVMLLLENRADPNNPAQQSGAGIHMPLGYAVENNMDQIATVLLDHGASANTGEGVLWTAVRARKYAIVKKVLSNGEGPDDDPVPAGTPLMAAVENRDEAMVKLLLAHGADPDYSTKFSGGSPLSRAKKLHARRILRELEAAHARKR